MGRERDKEIETKIITKEELSWNKRIFREREGDKHIFRKYLKF